MSLPVDRLLAGPAAPPPCAAGLAAARPQHSQRWRLAISSSAVSAAAMAYWLRLPRRTLVRMRLAGVGSPRNGTRTTGYPGGSRARRGTSATARPSPTNAAPVSHSLASCAMAGVKPAAAHAFAPADGRSDRDDRGSRVHLRPRVAVPIAGSPAGARQGPTIRAGRPATALGRIGDRPSVVATVSLRRRRYRRRR